MSRKTSHVLLQERKSQAFPSRELHVHDGSSGGEVAVYGEAPNFALTIDPSSGHISDLRIRQRGGMALLAIVTTHESVTCTEGGVGLGVGVDSWPPSGPPHLQLYVRPTCPVGVWMSRGSPAHSLLSPIQQPGLSGFCKICSCRAFVDGPIHNTQDMPNALYVLPLSLARSPSPASRSRIVAWLALTLGQPSMARVELSSAPSCGRPRAIMGHRRHSQTVRRTA